MRNANLLALTRQRWNALHDRFNQAEQTDKPQDTVGVAESLLPISQLYGFEMSYFHARDQYEK